MKKGIIQVIIFTLLFSMVGPFVAEAHEGTKEKNLLVNHKLQPNNPKNLSSEIELVTEHSGARVAPLVVGVVVRFIVTNSLKAAGKQYGKRAVVKLLGNELRKYSKPWNGFKKYRGATKTNGAKGSKKRYYEWDFTHQDIEVYDSKGKHLGSMDPFDGTMYKPAVKGRTIKL